MDSPEHKTLTQLYPGLVTCVGQSPNDVADQLKPFPILAPGDWAFLANPNRDKDQKARRIVDAALDQVKVNPKLFFPFVSALEAAGSWTEIVVNDLKLTHFTTLSATYTQAVCSQTHIRADSDSTLSVDNRDSPAQPQAMSMSELHSDSSSKDAKSLYHMVRAEPAAVGKVGFDRREKTLDRETNEMRRKFAALVYKVITSIKDAGVEVRALTRYLQHIEPFDAALVTARQSCLLFTTEVIHSMESGDVDDVFRLLKHYYSWFNFDIIEAIIKVFCKRDSDVKTELSDYKAEMKQYCKNRLCQFPDTLNELGEHGDVTKPYVFKIDKEWRTMRFSELETIKEIIRDILHLKREALLVQAVSNGCVEVVFGIPEHVADAVFPLSEDQLGALKKYGIQYCDGKSFLLSGECYSMTLSISLNSFAVYTHQFVIVWEDTLNTSANVNTLSI